MSDIFNPTGLILTDGTNTVSGTQKLTVTGGTVGGTSPNATLTVTSVKMATVWIGTPANSTITLISYAEYAFTIFGINNLFCSSGSITLTINKNGTPITGLNALSVTSIPQSPTASVNNSVVTGDRITMTLSSNSSSANLEFTMLGQ